MNFHIKICSSQFSNNISCVIFVTPEMHNKYKLAMSFFQTAKNGTAADM